MFFAIFVHIFHMLLEIFLAPCHLARKLTDSRTNSEQIGAQAGAIGMPTLAEIPRLSIRDGKVPKFKAGTANMSWSNIGGE